mmetsp:Transcript_59842/g.165526  ORF Transcript_59842/g.165526 Transcript_59842/m.165526 type:complete len:213 (-) Transcript_59842:163-801(-)|eukprot:CAMPEP_0179122598 /NCGR_PEP_ID=MMETSP0796-20121207/57866_1 /TAXON_ID=73915 /ORGANISM="Pyrodinium bahamense, Strain pbaha01" /LENGTH=212 /DNA_ID=CAMNT_0020821221 /DNA_START=62 /DNA_END=700 /DNA_ORIENTATION=+
MGLAWEAAARRRVLKPVRERRTRWTEVLAVRPSRIRGGGLGLFALKQLPRGYELPEPYKGRRVTEAQLSRMTDGSYLFLLSRGNLAACAAIDAKAVMENNPLRYANGARTASQRKRVNLKSQQRGRNVYFVTIRKVAAGEELLLDYGPNYWTGMRYQTRAKELRRELRKLRVALVAAPARGRQRRDLEEQIARTEFSKEQLEDFDDSDAESD